MATITMELPYGMTEYFEITIIAQWMPVSLDTELERYRYTTM